MASKRRKTTTKRAPARRKKKRVSRPVNWAAWLWVIAFANVIGGLLVSPITAPVKISLHDVRVSDRPHVEAVLEPFLQTPWLRLDKTAIESELGNLDHVRSATFEPNVFGRATVTFLYREPVSKLAVDRPAYIDGDGEVYIDPVGKSVPLVTVQDDYLDVSGSVIGQWPRAGVVQTVELMEKNLPQLDYSLELDAKSVLSLDVVDGPVVVLGSSRDLDAKIKKLAEIYAEPDLDLTDRATVNLMAPERPTTKTD